MFLYSCHLMRKNLMETNEKIINVYVNTSLHLRTNYRKGFHYLFN